MERDANGNITVTPDEYHADAVRLTRWCEENKVKLIVTDSKSRFVTGYFPPSLEEVSEQSRDAVIEAAKKLAEAFSLVWTGPEDMLVSEVMRQIEDQIFDVINAVAALKTHERKDGGA